MRINHTLTQITREGFLHFMKFLILLHDLESAPGICYHLGITQLAEQLIEPGLQHCILIIMEHTRHKFIKPFALRYKSSLLGLAQNISVFTESGCQMTEFNVGRS